MKQFALATLFLAVAVLACYIPVTSVTSPESTEIAVTSVPKTADVTAVQSLNVRERAGDDKRVLGALYNGNSVILTGKCSVDPDPLGWAEIVWGESGTAWVNADFLSKNKCSEEQ